MTPEQVQQIVRDELAANGFFMPDRFTVRKNMQFFDGYNLSFGGTNGSKIGTATTQKLGFFDATPVVRQSSPGAAAVQGGTYVQADVQSIATTVNNIGTALKNLGFTA